MLLAAELALLAIDPASGRHALGIRDKLNACLAGLLVGELVLGGHAEPGERDGTVVLTDDPAADPVLVATAQVVAVRGPKLKAVMSSMDRSLGKRLGTGTWDSVVATSPPQRPPSQPPTGDGRHPGAVWLDDLIRWHT